MPLKGIIIEHLESGLPKWIEIEYRHASRFVYDCEFVLTNFKDYNALSIVSSIFDKVYDKSISEISDLFDNLIILDPLASEELRVNDLANKDVYVVIGGILGDFPPRGRTDKFLSQRMPNVPKRNIGPYQFPIDSCVYIVVEMGKGRDLNDIPIVRDITLDLGNGKTVFLPYAYPLVEDKPLISDELIEMLKNE